MLARWTALLLATFAAACGGKAPAPAPEAVRPSATYGGVEIRTSNVAPLILRSSSVPRDVSRFDDGWIHLYANGADAPDGELLLDGVAVPKLPAPSLGIWDAEGVAVPGAGPGSTLVLDAKVGDLTGRHVFDCPPAVTISISPDPMVIGQPVTIRWSGELWWNGALSIAPDPEVAICYVGKPTYEWVVSCSTARAVPARGATEVTLVPPLNTQVDGYAIQVDLPGRLTQEQFPGTPATKWHSGLCVLRQVVPAASVLP